MCFPLSDFVDWLGAPKQLKQCVAALSDNAFVVRLIFRPKGETRAVLLIRPYAAVVEVPKNLVRQKRSELIGQNLSEKALALELARQAALATLSTDAEPVVWPCDEEALWYEDRPYVMDEKACRIN
jgi:hypothetical protein